MENKSSLAGLTLSIGVIITLLFLILKLVGVIDWSWFWVLFPLILDLAILILLCIIVAIIAFITLFLK